MTELTFYVAGMRCRRCVREVTARLRDVTGVETVTADAGASLVRLSGSMTVANIVCALAATTYRPHLADNGAGNSAANSADNSPANSAETELGQRGP